MISLGILGPCRALAQYDDCDDNSGLSYVHWERIAESIEREKHDAMNMRVRRLWAPVLSILLISVSVQFVALRVPQLPPRVLFTRNGVSIVLAPLWMLALPFIGALGAWLSLRAGGNTRDRLLTALSPAWLMGGIMTLGVALSPVIERHFSLSIKLTAYIVYMIAQCLVPAVLLALGALPWLGRKATMRARVRGTTL